MLCCWSSSCSTTIKWGFLKFALDLKVQLCHSHNFGLHAIWIYRRDINPSELEISNFKLDLIERRNKVSFCGVDIPKENTPNTYTVRSCFFLHVYVWIGSVYAHQIPETNKQQKIRRRATEFTFQSIRQSMGKLDTCFKSSKLIWVFLPREPQNILSTKMFVKIFVPNAHRRFDFKPLYSSPLLFFLLLLSSSYFLHYVFVSYFFALCLFYTWFCSYIMWEWVCVRFREFTWRIQRWSLVLLILYVSSSFVHSKDVCTVIRLLCASFCYDKSFSVIAEAPFATLIGIWWCWRAFADYVGNEMKNDSMN